MKLPEKWAFVDESGRAVLEIQDIFKLPLDEGFIREKSVEMFNDPDPCVIHKSAVIKRVILDACARGGAGELARHVVMPEGAVTLLFQ